jgi:chemotaxis protein MotB
MAVKQDRKAKGGTIIIRREEVVEGGHHGGAWKVAYADFVTAMMAFFLLMWLLNATTEAQRKGLADYFSPNNLMSHASSGTGQPFGGHTAYDEGNMVSDKGTVQITEGKRPPIDQVDEGETQVFTRLRKPGQDNVTDPTEEKPDPSLTDPTQTGAAATGAGPNPKLARDISTAEIDAEKDRREKASFEKAAEDIRAAVRADPALADIAKQLSIDMTPEGLRIQIMDEIKAPMFASGSALPNDRARELIRMVVPILQKLTQPISISGHTDATPFAGAGKTNWELSTERANATRRLLTDGGLADTRIRTVTGHADRDPLLPGDPFAAANRRIAILVLREAHSVPGEPAPASHPARAALQTDPAHAEPSPGSSSDPSRAAANDSARVASPDVLRGISPGTARAAAAANVMLAGAQAPSPLPKDPFSSTPAADAVRVVPFAVPARPLPATDAAK